MDITIPTTCAARSRRWSGGESDQPIRFSLFEAYRKGMNEPNIKDLGLEVGAGPSSHGRGLWFNPSIAHQ